MSRLDSLRRKRQSESKISPLFWPNTFQKQSCDHSRDRSCGKRGKSTDPSGTAECILQEVQVMITIRQETPADHAEIYSLIQTAFASAEHRDGNEQDLVDALRKSEAFIPELSLVAQLDGRIAGTYPLYQGSNWQNHPVILGAAVRTSAFPAAGNWNRFDSRRTPDRQRTGVRLLHCFGQ